MTSSANYDLFYVFLSSIKVGSSYLPWFLWRQFLSCNKFPKRLLTIKVLLLFSVFKFSSSFASFCFPEFKNIFKIFLFMLEIFPVTQFFNVKKFCQQHADCYLFLTFMFLCIVWMFPLVLVLPDMKG